MSIIKLLEEEVTILTDFQSRNNDIVVQIGAATLRIDALDRQKQELLEKFQDLQKDQTEFGKKVQEKYGDGSINLEKGEFTASK
jgi:hypothetical protein|tara:strand:+ start:563 stop:814 length:252 start_codon:yes stop_codon:yes gene_type:complete